MKEKHNKEQHDYLATSCWYKKIITDPYQVIAEFFTFADITFYRKMIKSVLLFTYRSKIYRKDDPGNLLYEFKILESVINAAYMINKEKKKSPVKVEDCSLLNKNLYCGRHAGSSEWDFFPRSLKIISGSLFAIRSIAVKYSFRNTKRKKAGSFMGSTSP